MENMFIIKIVTKCRKLMSLHLGDLRIWREVVIKSGNINL